MFLVFLFLLLLHTQTHPDTLEILIIIQYTIHVHQHAPSTRRHTNAMCGRECVCASRQYIERRTPQPIHWKQITNFCFTFSFYFFFSTFSVSISGPHRNVVAVTGTLIRTHIALTHTHSLASRVHMNSQHLRWAELYLSRSPNSGLTPRCVCSFFSFVSLFCKFKYWDNAFAFFANRNTKWETFFVGVALSKIAQKVRFHFQIVKLCVNHEPLWRPMGICTRVRICMVVHDVWCVFEEYMMMISLTCDSCGTQTRRFCVHSACVAGSLNWFFSTVRYFNSGSLRSIICSSLILLSILSFDSPHDFNISLSSNFCILLISLFVWRYFLVVVLLDINCVFCILFWVEKCLFDLMLGWTLLLFNLRTSRKA